MSNKGIISGVRLDPTRWQGYSHEELYKLLHDGPGAAASALPTQRWTEIANTMADVDADLRGALNRSADGWRGDAALSAYERLGTLATWADTANVNATAMRDATQRQAENIAKARADMPAPTKVPPAGPDPTAAPAVQVLNLTGDQEGVDAAKSAGEQSAHEVMAAYQVSTESTVESLGTFTAPERVAAPQQDEHGRRHGHGILGLTSSAGLVDGILGHHDHGSHGHHHHSNGGRTSSSGAEWVNRDTNPAPRYSPPSSSSGGRAPLEFGPMPGRGRDRGETRRSPVGRTSMPGTSGPVSGVELGGPSVNSVMGAPGSTNGGPHLVSGANPSATVINPNEMPPPATANGTMTANAAGGPGAAGGTAAQGAGGDKLLGRRGFEAGPGAWNSAPEPTAPSSVGGAPARRRDFKPQVRVTETVSVDGEDVKLPETVIGDGS